MLRLVHPAPKGQENATSSVPKMGLGRKSAALTPTRDEQKRISAAVLNAGRAFGGLDVLAAVMKVPVGTLYQVRRSTSYAMAVLVARAAGIPVEQVLSGKPHEAGSCALCGRKGAR